jgi:hypothetical protein
MKSVLAEFLVFTGEIGLTHQLFGKGINVVNLLQMKVQYAIKTCSKPLSVCCVELWLNN